MSKISAAPPCSDNMSDYIKELVSYLRESFSPGQRTTLKIEFVPELPIDKKYVVKTN